MSPVVEAIAIGIGELIAIILKAPDQAAALERAKFYAARDAAKIAAEEYVRRELKK